MSTPFFAEISPRILVVDDDVVIRILFRQFLESEGYIVDQGADGEAALDLIDRNHYDLVILDIAMPGIDGATVCENINATRTNPPPVLMITALDDEETIDRSFNAGAIDFIRKPIRWPVLKNRIRYIIGSYRSKTEQELLSKNYEMILDAAANGICGVNKDGTINYINPAGLSMLGFKEEDVIGQAYLSIFRLSIPGSEEFEVDCCPFFKKNEKKNSAYFEEARLVRSDGTILAVEFTSTPIIERNTVCGGVLIFQDITERQEAAELVRYMANHDTLTHLPNRNYFRRRLPQAISLARRQKRRLCLLFIDLDRFKPINDTYGHGIGDMVLVQVAQRLGSTLRSSDSVCRLGGDEFVILLESTDTPAGAKNVAQKAIDLLNEPIEIDNHICYIGASIGISVFPDDCSDAESMLRHADIAMYQAKRNGRNCLCFYAESE